MPSFDIVSELQMHEVDNAVQQAQKEVTTRFDFRGADADVERTDDGIVLRASGEGRLEAVLSVLREKFAKRKVSLRALDPQTPESASRGAYRQLVKLKQGISKEKASEIVKVIKDSKKKAQASIQGDLVRVSAKDRDTLQEIIALLRAKDFGIDMQFTNYRTN